MNIWIINHFAYTPADSGSTRHFCLARELITRGHLVRIFASSFFHKGRRQRPAGRGVFGDQVVENVPFTWIRSPGYKSGLATRAFNMVVFAVLLLWLPVRHRRNPPDVVVGSSPDLLSAWAAERLARRFGVPFVLEITDLWPDTLVELGGYDPSARWIRALAAIERLLYRRAESILCLLPAGTARLVAKGANPSAVHWLPNGVDIQTVPSPSPPAAHDRPVLMYAGAHALANMLDGLLDAAVLLKQDGFDGVEIRLIGDGPHKPRLVERAEREGLDMVQFYDSVSNRQIYPLLAEADMFVSLWKDSTLYDSGISPTKMFDYLAMARPVILAARTPWDPVTEFDAGLTVPPEEPRALADAIKQLAELPADRRWEMGMNGRRYVESRHDFAAVATILEQVLAEVVDTAASRG